MKGKSTTRGDGRAMLGDIQSKPLIVVKGALFLVCIVLCAGWLLVERPAVHTALLILTLIWASARFYYFLFYVLQTYVDPSLKYAGLLALIRTLLRRGAGKP